MSALQMWAAQEFSSSVHRSVMQFANMETVDFPHPAQHGYLLHIAVPDTAVSDSLFLQL